MSTKLPSVSQTLADLKTNTDALHSAAAVLVAHVCQNALRSAASVDAASPESLSSRRNNDRNEDTDGGKGKDDDDDDGDSAVVSAAAVQHQFSNALLASAGDSSSSSVGGGNNQQRQAFMQLLDIIFKSSEKPPDRVSSKLTELFKPVAPKEDLVNVAWTVMRTEFATELPAAVAESFRKSSSSSVISSLIVNMLKGWVTKGIFASSPALETQRLVLEGIYSAEAKKRLEEQQRQDGAAAAAAELEAAASVAKITAADARKRIALLKHLCEGLEAAPVGVADVAALRAALADYGGETVAKAGGEKRWGTVAAGGTAEVRAVASVLAGQVDLPSSKQQKPGAAENGAADDDDGEEDVALSKDPVRLLEEACDSIDDALRNLAEATAATSSSSSSTLLSSMIKKVEQRAKHDTLATSQQQQQQHHSTSIPKRYPLPLPVSSSFVLDRSADAAATASGATRLHLISPDDAPSRERGPKPAPDMVTPFSVPARVSNNGALASRAWSCDPDAWATARVTATDLPWVTLHTATSEHEDQAAESAAEEQQQHSHHPQQGAVKKISAAMAASLFFASK